MIPSRVLCFELFGDYAQFRKFFANMSPLSFSIPPRTVLTGIIGAILGIDKNCNPEYFDYDNSFIALKLISPVKKTKIVCNYIKTSSSFSQVFNYKEHKPTNIEFLKDVRYRVYFSCIVSDNSLMKYDKSFSMASIGFPFCSKIISSYLVTSL